MDLENYIPIPQAAKELAVTSQAIHLAVNENRLPSVMFHGRRLISRTDLAAYKQRTRPTGEKSKGRPRKQDPDASKT